MEHQRISYDLLSSILHLLSSTLDLLSSVPLLGVLCGECSPYTAAVIATTRLFFAAITISLIDSAT